MACACKANQKIEYIYKKYGYKKETKHTHIRRNIKIFLKDILVWIVLIPLLPIILIHIFYVLFFTDDKKISIAKIVKNVK